MMTPEDAAFVLVSGGSRGGVPVGKETFLFRPAQVRAWPLSSQAVPRPAVAYLRFTVGLPPAQISGETVDFDVSIRVVEIEGEGLVVIEYKLDRVFGFYQGSTIYPIQREYYKQTYGGGLRWSQSQER
jgi:hypothetical protein